MLAEYNAQDDSRSLYICIRLCVLLYHILHMDVHIYVMCRGKEKNICCMPFCTAPYCCRHQSLPGTVPLVRWKVFGSLLCVFSVHFSDSHLKLAELKPVASNSSSTLGFPQFLLLCLQLEMKEVCFLRLFPLKPPFSFLSGTRLQSSDPQRGQHNFLTT